LRRGSARASIRFGVVGGAILLLLGATSVIVGWRASNAAMHPGAAKLAWSLGDFPSLRPATMTVHSRTGVDLAGRFFRGRAGATVVLSHGYGGNQDEMLPVTAALHAAGFNVFTYDLRGCGGSGGAVTLGALEQEDLRSVLDAVAAHAGVDPSRIGALGFSMGAATTVLEAAGDPRVKAVVDDSGWADVRHWVKPRWREVLLRPTWHFTPLSLSILEVRSGVDLDKLRPVEAIHRLSPRPTMIIHGADDTVVPPRDSELNYAAAASPRDLWLVPAASHGDTLRPGGATSSQRVIAFFERALRGNDARS
jgi:uncharacterized protein